MLDLDLLQSFVAVVEARSFTRAAERIHRTQSTVSQQIRKLERAVGTALLHRTTAAGQISLTDDGEALLRYAQRILSLAREAESVIGNKKTPRSIVRLGLPEDFKSEHLTSLLADFARAHPDIRVDTVCGLTTEIEPLVGSGDLDLALMKREVGSGPCIARWPEALVWIAAKGSGIRLDADPVPLAVFPQGCLYRARAIHAMDSRHRRWRIAYASASLTGILAAVSSGLAVTLLARSAVPTGMRVLNGQQRFPDVPPTELALVAAEPRPQAAMVALSRYICAEMAAVR